MAAQSDTGLHPISVLELAPLPTAIPCFRLHAAAVLTEWGLPRNLVQDAQVLVSELMTNAMHVSAVLPGRPPVTLRLLAGGTSLLIEAWDQSPLDLEARQAGDHAESGRGLTVVAALSTRWGCRRADCRRKVVWAELALHAALSEAPQSPDPQ